MKLVDRYLAATVVRATLLTLLVLTVLTFVLALIEELDDVGKGNYGFVDALMVAISATPRFIYQAFPLSALIGALLGVGGLANSGELTAMRAAGMTTGRIVWAVVKAGILLMALVMVLGDGIGPPLEQYGDELKQQRQNRQVTFNSRHGFWAKDGNAFVNVRGIAPNGVLQGLSIYRFDEQQRLLEVTAAAQGVYQEQGWELRQVRHVKVQDDRLQIRRQPAMPWGSQINPSVLQAALINPLKLPVWDLYYQVQNLEQRGQNPISYAVAFWGKFATPLMTLGMLLLALPLVMASSRSVSAGQRIFLGILIGTLFFMLNRGYSFAVAALQLPAMSILFFPLFLFAVTYVVIRQWAH